MQAAEYAPCHLKSDHKFFTTLFPHLKQTKVQRRIGPRTDQLGPEKDVRTSVRLNSVKFFRRSFQNFHRIQLGHNNSRLHEPKLSPETNQSKEYQKLAMNVLMNG